MVLITDVNGHAQTVIFLDDVIYVEK